MSTNITTRTIEITLGRIYDYKAGYSQYLELRKERRAQQQKQYEEQQKMIAETKLYIERFKGHLLQNQPSAEPRAHAREVGTRGGRRRRHLAPQTQVPALAPQRQLSGHHGECGQT